MRYKNVLNMSEERVVKKWALQKSISEHTIYKENSPTGFNANQSNQMLGTDLSETVVGYEMVAKGLDQWVNMTTGVLVHNSGIVTKPEDCIWCKNNVGHSGFECNSVQYGSGPGQARVTSSLSQAPLFTTAMSVQKCKVCSFQTQSCKASRARRKLGEHIRKIHAIEDGNPEETNSVEDGNLVYGAHQETTVQHNMPSFLPKDKPRLSRNYQVQYNCEKTQESGPARKSGPAQESGPEWKSGPAQASGPARESGPAQESCLARKSIQALRVPRLICRTVKRTTIPLPFEARSV